MTLTEAAIEVARAELGVCEVGGDNQGPRVEEYQRSVGLHPGDAWCCAFLHFVFEQAARRLGLVNPVPRVGAALRAWKLTEPVCRISNPIPGAVYVLDHGEGLGHIGIVTAVDADGTPTEISGNTFASKGGRAGNCVAEHHGTPEVTHGGTLLPYLNFDLAARHPNALA
jgi:uncharacterized protein (TIGR02594 family)